MGKCQLTYEDRAKGGRAKKRMKLRERGRAAARKRWGDRPAPTADEQQQQKQPKGPKQPTKAELTAQIAQLKNTIAELKAQNNALRRRLLSVKSRPRLIQKTPIYRLIAPTTSNHRLVAPTTPTCRLTAPNSKPTILTNRQQSSEIGNPTQQFVAAFEEAEEEERKDVALLLNNNNSMATTSSSTPTNVEASTGFYTKKKQNAITKQNQLANSARRRGYMLFSSELGRQLMEENPSVGFAEVSEIVAIEWERLSDQQKRHQYERAEKRRVQVHAVQQRQQQQPHHDHDHPSSASSGGSSSSTATAEDSIKEEAMDNES